MQVRAKYYLNQPVIIFINPSSIKQDCYLIK